ncbi:hypothetical protein B4U79_02928 [Dinothrombium tinctorium]|uniref:Uncharacterized protein n=1 Tax=Dinothrombium tinctorium TaxID=1965070 RepID=A0A443RFS3_9ACAR|nr:hypothetical protein B4U79_02928 [Dinothrombium tinctorium]
MRSVCTMSHCRYISRSLRSLSNNSKLLVSCGLTRQRFFEPF